MAWTKVKAGGIGDQSLYTEDITLPTSASTTMYSSSFSVPYGESFFVFTNTAAVNTTEDGDVDLQVSWDDTTFVTLVADIEASFDTITGVYLYNPQLTAAHGSAPFYRLAVTSDGNQAGETFGVAVTFKGRN